MQIAHLFWPPDRKLFRQRSRWRALLPVAAALAVAVLALAFGRAG